jgi:hypothetical protein
LLEKKPLSGCIIKTKAETPVPNDPIIIAQIIEHRSNFPQGNGQRVQGR